ncbi:MAG: hypothetical protein AUK44_10865 [Porphyromonadaceae bacterium CG2_30_38_12]|nr:MAG: hypothetical protein AUK44_10865 [Porphyromonadaceae bacterium CG2_30_38_12]
MVVLICAHFLWKFTVIGDETDTQVQFFGFDISAPFSFMASHVASASYFILHALGSDVQLLTHNWLRYPNHVNVQIVWSCSGLKQAYIFTCIIAFSHGKFVKKMWFIPLGLVVVYFVNIIRIAAITALIEHHPEQFELLHEHIFKYAFYAFVFALWVWWEEKISH